MPFNSLIGLALGIPAILIAITFHEYGHGRVASMLGDPTPANQGRLTLNPLAHLDPLGALLLVLAGFGWAKPVQVNPLYFRGDRRRGMMMVSVAGPFMNLLLAYLAALALRLSYSYGPSPYLAGFLGALLTFNVVLAVFNLIPVPPLDGSKILAGILPRNAAMFIYQLESYGPIILILLVATGVIGRLLRPLVNVVLSAILVATGSG